MGPLDHLIPVIEGFVGSGDDVVIVAGLPFGEPGTTNLLHISRVPGESPARSPSQRESKPGTMEP